MVDAGTDVRGSGQEKDDPTPHSKVVGGTVPEIAPGGIQGSVREIIPGRVPEIAPGGIQGSVQEIIPGRVPEIGPGGIQGSVQEIIPRRVPEIALDQAAQMAVGGQRGNSVVPTGNHAAGTGSSRERGAERDQRGHTRLRASTQGQGPWIGMQTGRRETRGGGPTVILHGRQGDGPQGGQSPQLTLGTASGRAMATHQALAQRRNGEELGKRRTRRMLLTSGNCHLLAWNLLQGLAMRKGRELTL